MKLNKRRQLAQVALFSLMALGAGTALAQTERGAKGGGISQAQFDAKLQASDRQLASIEQLITRIDATKLPAEKEKLFDELSQPLAAYAKSMTENFDTAMKQAERAAKSQGEQGSTRLVKPFEDLAVRHERRMKTLDERAQKIAREIAKEEGGTQSTSFAAPAEGTKVAHSWPVLEKIGNFFISPAHAAAAIPVVAACGSLTVGNVATWLPCVKSLVIAIPAGVAAVNQFQSCWAAAHRHKLKKDGHVHLPAAMHTKCVAVLIAKLA